MQREVLKSHRKQRHALRMEQRGGINLAATAQLNRYYHLTQVLPSNIGNKWSVIAKRLNQKNDNSVKNHFYSSLRKVFISSLRYLFLIKVLRKLNSVICTLLRKQFRQINISLIYKLVQATEQKFKEKPLCNLEVSLACRQVQNKLLQISLLDQFPQPRSNVQFYRSLITDIYSASKMYKKKGKKYRHNSLKFNLKTNKLSPRSQGYVSDVSSFMQDEDYCIKKQSKDKKKTKANNRIQQKVEKRKKMVSIRQQIMLEREKVQHQKKQINVIQPSIKLQNMFNNEYNQQRANNQIINNERQDIEMNNEGLNIAMNNEQLDIGMNKEELNIAMNNKELNIGINNGEINLGMNNCGINIRMSNQGQDLQINNGLLDAIQYTDINQGVAMASEEQDIKSFLNNLGMLRNCSNQGDQGIPSKRKPRNQGNLSEQISEIQGEYQREQYFQDSDAEQEFQIKRLQQRRFRRASFQSPSDQ